MPLNPAAKGMADGLASGHTAYGQSEGIVLFVTQPGERNAFDQRWLEYHLLQEYVVFSFLL